MGKTKVKSETAIVHEIHKILTAWKREGEPIWWVKVHGNPMQKAGLPDFLIVYCGRTFAVEIKRPGQKTTLLQLETLRQIGKAGGVPSVIQSASEFILHLRHYKRPPRLAAALERECCPGPAKPPSGDVAQRGRLPG